MKNIEIPAAEPPAGSLDRILHGRRATPHFTDEPVPEEVLTLLLRAAALAPSGFNLQPWRFLVLRDAGNRRRLRVAAHDQAKITEAPVVIVAYAPRREWRDRLPEVFAEAVRLGAAPTGGLEKRKADALHFIDTLPLATWLNRQVMIAFTYLMLAAEVYGWDTAPMEGFDSDQVRTACDLPQETEIVALLAIGKAVRPGAVFPGRFTVSRIAFAENPRMPWPG